MFSGGKTYSSEMRIVARNVGGGSVTVHVSQGATVLELKNAIVEAHPDHLGKDLMWNGIPLQPNDKQVVDFGIKTGMFVVPVHLQMPQPSAEDFGNPAALQNDKLLLKRAVISLCNKGASPQDVYKALKAASFDYKKTQIFYGLGPLPAEHLGLPEEALKSDEFRMVQEVLRTDVHMLPDVLDDLIAKYPAITKLIHNDTEKFLLLLSNEVDQSAPPRAKTIFDDPVETCYTLKDEDYQKLARIDPTSKFSYRELLEAFIKNCQNETATKEYLTAQMVAKAGNR